jgi:hypothetical protein
MKTHTKILIAIALIAFGVTTRFLPHLWNFTAVTAIALFATNYLGAKWSMPTVVVTMFISDLFLGFYQKEIMLAVYASFLLVALLPKLLKGNSVFKILGLSISGSLVFFFITNTAVWLFETMYPANFSGLIASYVAGIPFLKNAIIGDMWYTFALFGVYESATYLAKQKSLASASDLVARN